MFRDLPQYANTTQNTFWADRTPAHWSVHPGLAVLNENRRKNTGLAESQVLSLSYGKVVVKPVEKQRGLVPESYEGYQILEPGDIVVRPTDLQNDQTSIRVGHVRDHGIITSAYIGLRPRGEWSASYAFRYLTVVDSSKLIYGMGNGLRQQLSWSDLRRMPCLVPPADEQAAIVKYLDHANARIDKAIAAKRQLIRLLEERAEVQTARLFDDLGSPQRLATVLWEGPTNGTSPQVSERGDLETLSISVVRNGLVDVRDVDIKYVDRSAVTQVEKYQLRAGDALVVRGNGNIKLVGRVGLVTAEMNDRIYPDLLMRIRFRSGVNPRFMVAALNSRAAREQIENAVRTAVGTYKLSGADVRRIRVPIPTNEIQQAVVDSVDAIVSVKNEVVAKLSNEISLLQEFRNRLVADVVTGQVDVRAIAATLPDAPDAFDELDTILDDELEEALSENPGE